MRTRDARKSNPFASVRAALIGFIVALLDFAVVSFRFKFDFTYT